jgi:CheY-like chemotaxis protein
MATGTDGAAGNRARPDTGTAGETVRIGDQFVASLNHDIRTPLSGIMGMTDLLLETELSEEQRDYVSTARLCADQLLEMLNSALEYAALTSGGVKLEKTEFHLPKALEELLRECRPKAEAKRLKLSLELSAGLPEYVVGDELRLRQALQPLLSNAVKFTPSGEVEVRARLNGSSEANRISLVVAVRDTGIGIPAARLPEIFESFRQLEAGLSRPYAGMGLGLALARKLAGLLGGGIEVQSQLGQGSTFTLNVPLSLPHALAAGTSGAEATAEPDDGRPQVLFVDDNEVARRIVLHILKRSNYRAVCAEGGQQGIDAARRTRFDLILMDLQMPVVNGLEATSVIRTIPGYQGTPILALTANYSEEFLRRCREAGFQGFVSKPIQREDLLREMRRHIPDASAPQSAHSAD